MQGNHADAARRFMAGIGAEHHALTFEDLTVDPDRTIAGLNDFLGLDLRLEDFEKIYRGPLYRRRWSKTDYAKAIARYLYCSKLRRAAITFPQAPRDAS